MPNRLSLALLALGSFAVGTDAFVIAGILPRVADDLKVSQAIAGQLVTVFALAYAIGAPVLVTASGRVARRRLLVGALVAFTAANLLAASAPSYSVLFLARIAAALGAALFTGPAAAVAAGLVPQEFRGRALAVVTGGITVATALGVPLGTLIGQTLNWRATFLLIVIFGAVATLGLQRALPAVPAAPTVGLRERITIAARPSVLAALSVILLAFTGGFTVYTYVAPVLQQAASISHATLSAVLLVFGLAAVAGNIVGGQATDRYGAQRTLTGGLAGLAAALAALGLVAALAPQPRMLAAALATVAVAAWATAGWTITPAQQHRLISFAPQAPPVALSLNASAMYAGIALGGAIGGLVLSYASLTVLPWIGSGFALTSLGLLLLTGASGPTASRSTESATTTAWHRSETDHDLRL